MSFKIKDFATIRILSVDVKESRDWYAQFFGVDPIEDSEEFVSFKIKGVCFDIAEADAKSPSSPGGSVGYWLVDDLDEAVKHAIDLGAEIYRGPLKVEEIHRTIVQLRDPQGNVLGLEEAL